MVALNFEFGITQIVIIVVGVVALGGYLIAKKNYEKKKQQEEDVLDSMGSAEIQAPSEGISEPQTGEVSPEEKPLKDYIDQYKSQYDKEAIKSALVNAGNSQDLVDRCVEKYF